MTQASIEDSFCIFYYIEVLFFFSTLFNKTQYLNASGLIDTEAILLKESTILLTYTQNSKSIFLAEIKYDLFWEKMSPKWLLISTCSLSTARQYTL